jgi:hypothetical protein
MGYGTPALLDQQRNVWLYNFPNAIDPLLTQDFAAAIVHRTGETGTARSEIRLFLGDVFYEATLRNIEEYKEEKRFPNL